jgi:hypothetical protein
MMFSCSPENDFFDGYSLAYPGGVLQREEGRRQQVTRTMILGVPHQHSLPCSGELYEGAAQRYLSSLPFGLPSPPPLP